jgi:hypothetical protein
LGRRPRVDQCLFAVVMEAYLHGTSTRKVNDLVKALVADLGGRDVVSCFLRIGSRASRSFAGCDSQRAAKNFLDYRALILSRSST